VRRSSRNRSATVRCALLLFVLIHLAVALVRAGGVKAEAARLLGLKPSALYYKLEKYGIEAE